MTTALWPLSMRYTSTYHCMHASWKWLEVLLKPSLIAQRRAFAVEGQANYIVTDMSLKH